jgi:hypothetical protein
MKKVFDQEQPKSPLAQSLNAAFAGCDTWTVAPPKRRAAAAVSAPKRARLTPASARYL